MKALVVVDVQKDFTEGGSLAVDGGNVVAERLGSYLRHIAPVVYDEIVFTKDYHDAPPADNGGHFSDNPDFVDSWPVHCVAGEDGSAFHDAISHQAKSYHTFYKGQGHPHYSGFQAYAVTEMGTVYLEEYLTRNNITEVDIVGIAGDVCVKETAKDAVNLGFEVNLLPYFIASVGGPTATSEANAEIQRLQGFENDGML